MGSKTNKDILGRVINDGDFVIYTSHSAGLRVGLVVCSVVEDLVGALYPQKKIRVLMMDYRKLETVPKLSYTPNANRTIIYNELPDSYKKLLLDKAKELQYA